MALVKEIIDGTKTLLTGMKVTLDNFRKPPITSQYPMERIEMSKAFRNVIVLIEKDDIGSHDCIDCKACERVCPSFCISLDGGRVEGLKRKRATAFKVDFALCSDCGLCLDVCPTDTLGYSQIHDEAGYKRSDFLYDLIEPWADKEEAALERLKEIEAKQAAERAQRAAAKKAAKKVVKKAVKKPAAESGDNPPENDDA